MLMSIKFNVKGIAVLVLGILAGLIFGCHHSNQSSLNVSDQAILIYNANIINVMDGTIAFDQAIVIDSGVIQAINDYEVLKSSIVAENSIDADHKFVIPGLWDMHVHIEGEDLVEDNKALFPVYIAYGITTVRDMASDLGEQVLRWRDDINEGKLPGPQIFTAGRKLEGVNSIWKGDLEIANEEELDQMLDKLEAYQVDLVKITENTLSGELFLKSVKASKKRGFMVSGHVPIDLTVMELVAEGFTSIEHASYLLRLGANEDSIVRLLKSGAITKSAANEYYNSNFNQEKANKAYQELSEFNMAVTPTLIGGKQLAFLDENNHSQDDFLKLLTNRFTSNYQWRIDRMANDTPEQKQARKDRYERIADQLPYLQAAGIVILAGSDAAALNTFVYPALALHEELVLFQDAGLTPLQILQSATINGAKLMGKYDMLSTVEVGKEADLIILNNNPLEDISATQDIQAVINNGKYFDRRKLDQLLEGAQQVKKRLDNERDRKK